LADFEELIHSLPGQQRRLMGLDNEYPTLAEAQAEPKDEGILDFVKSHAPTPTNIKNYAQSGASQFGKAMSGNVGGALGDLEKSHLGGSEEDESKSLKVVMARRKKKTAEASEKDEQVMADASPPPLPLKAKASGILKKLRLKHGVEAREDVHSDAEQSAQDLIKDIEGAGGMLHAVKSSRLRKRAADAAALQNKSAQAAGKQGKQGMVSKRRRLARQLQALARGDHQRASQA
jgi:hypothetical protein